MTVELLKIQFKLLHEDGSNMIIQNAGIYVPRDTE
jgi:hypothetical protein